MRSSTPSARAPSLGKPMWSSCVLVEQYKQWNAAFDAGFAAALGKPLIILHPEELTHALKEVDAAALAVAREHHQVAEILQYVIAQ